MPFEQVLALIGAILSFLVLILVIYMLVSKNKSQDLNNFENSILDEVKGMENTMTKSITDSMLNFNKLVNEQLLNQSKLSSDSIADFRVNINNQLSTFKDNINTNLTKDFKSLNDNIEKRMSDINGKVEQRLNVGFDNTNKTFVQIAERVKVIDEAQKKIEGLSNEMVSLQNILSNNQTRGAFGEGQLNNILRSVFGDNKKLFDTQYTIKKSRNETVRADAVVFLPEPHGLIAIDCKSPYNKVADLFTDKEVSKEEEKRIISEFGRDVKKHITDVANKYIVAGVTAKYALMFVPNDGILALIHKDLPNVIDYARDKYVTIVSPTTLIPLLSSFQAIMIDYEYSKHTREIIVQLNKIQKSFKMFNDEWGKLNRTINTLQNDRDKVNNRVEKMTTDLNKVGKNAEDNVKVEEETAE